MKACALCGSIGMAFLFVVLPAMATKAANPGEGEALLMRMTSAYETVKDYRVLVRVVLDPEDAGRRIEEFIYTFKRPGKIHMEFRMPQPGTVVVFPDEEGQVLVRPWGWRSLDFHLAPDSVFLSTPSGQRVDQTDFGLLFRNMERSMDGGRRGPLEISEDNQYIKITVLAENHFRKGKVTKYRFTIDRNTLFPVEIDEWTPEGVLERKITFRELVINTGVSDSFFRP